MQGTKCFVSLYTCRYGKPVAVDMMDADLYDTCVRLFDDIESGLFDSIINKSILENEK